MTYRIPLMRTSLLHEDETLTALADWLRDRPERLSMGSQCAEFERQFAAWQGRREAVLFNSGASANLALLSVLKQTAGLSSLGFSGLTWPTNITPALELGIRVHPFDVRCDTLNIDLPGDLSSIDTLFVTNALGYLGDMPAISQRCAEQKRVLLEDNCESLGTIHADGTKAGNFGWAATFSFFVAHHMSTIEGGMVCTDNPQLAEWLRMVRANGWDRNLSEHQQTKWRSTQNITEFDARYTFYMNGYNLRPTEITGFLGVQQLKYLDENIQTRLYYYLILEEVLGNNPHLMLLDHSHLKQLSPFAFPVICKTQMLRQEYIERFSAAGVEIRPIIAGNIITQPFYQQYRRASHIPTPPLPNTEFISKHGFYFGLYPDMTHEDIETLRGCLK